MKNLAMFKETKFIRKSITIIISIALALCLTSCANFETKAKNSIDAYMKTLMNLKADNYVEFVNENLGNPYMEAGLSLDQLKQGQIEYFINSLSKIKYEIVEVNETNKMAEVKVSYVDSNEYITKMFEQLFTYAFSSDYTEEGENQIYLDVMNSIEEDKFVEDTVYFGLENDGSISTTTNNIFDVATAGLYRIMLGDPGEIQSIDAKYTAEELLANVDFKYEIIDENTILVTFTNNNDVAVSPRVDFIFSDVNGNYVIQSQADINVLMPGETNYTSAYNELSDECVSLKPELQIGYFEDDLVVYDNSLVPYEITQTNDEVDIIFTNNTDETIDINGGYIVYGTDNQIVYVGDLSIYDLNPGESDHDWFYVNCTYDEINDIVTIEPYDRIEIYPVAHNQVSDISCK